jgi:glucose-6-phosphate dehydrogenase assembly protein OpcA
VSALAALPGERTEWSGTDVSADALAARLMRMNHDHARHAHGHAATRTLNLLVAPGGDVARAELDARLAGLRTRHPSRTIVLHAHAAERLDATLAIECAIGAQAGGTGWCHDAVELRADAERLRHADSLVHPLLVGGLPIVLWLPGAGANPAESALARLAEAIVLDSNAALATGSPASAFARALPLTAAARVRDLAWLRLARWRQRVASRFDDPAARALLGAVDRLELRFGGADAATPLLLAGWIAARAGWTLTHMHGGERWEGEARRRDGARVALALGCPPGDDAPAGIHALTLRAADAEVRIVEPVAELDPARAFAAALGGFDESAPGYAPALRAIASGLDVA